MKIISLLQPFAQLLVQGFKQVETRSWSTKYRGPVFIHASGELNKKMKNFGGISSYDIAVSNEHFRKYIPNPNKMVFGRIIGMVSIDEVFKVGMIPPPDPFISKLTLEELAFGNYELGRYMWFCSNAREFKRPILVKGTQGLRDYNNTTHCAHCDNGKIAPKEGIHITEDGRNVPCYNIRLF
jgi:activating signal cointegrator 1